MTGRWLLLLAVGLSLYACTSSVGTDSDTIPESPEIADYDSEAEAWIDSVISGMTLEEMAGQTIMPAIYTSADASTMRRLRGYIADCSIGGIVLLKGDTISCQAITSMLRELEAEGFFVAMDAEWGLGMRLEGAPTFPANAGIPDNATETQLYDYGYEVARQCRGMGINMLLGPVLDVVPKSTTGGAIGRRSFGADSRRAASLGTAYARGLEDGNVMSVAKHFPGHGATLGDSHESLPVVSASIEELRQRDLAPFNSYIRSGLSGIMMGHIYVPALDSINRPASVSPAIMQSLLRNEMGFHGLIITDALNMHGADGYTSAEALMAGADMVICPADTRLALQGIIEAVHTGKITDKELKDKCRRILHAKYRFCRSQTPPLNEPLFTRRTQATQSALAQ